VVDVINELKEYYVDVDVYDPWVDKEEAQHEYGISPIEKPEQGAYDGVVIAVGHEQFKQAGADIQLYGKKQHVLYDLKYVFPERGAHLRL